MTTDDQPAAETSTPGGALGALLLLQDADLLIDQLRYRRAHLPEQKRIDEIAAEKAAIVAKAKEQETELAALLKRQSELEEEIAETTKRISTIETRLQSGSVASFRDQSAMGDEINSLMTRRSEFEDAELEVMELLEPLTGEHDSREQSFSEMATETADLTESVHELQSSIDASLTVDEAQRASLVAPVPADLLKDYERIRSHLGGVGAARVTHGTCGGCHMALPNNEIDTMRKASSDTVFHCEQCGRILVIA